MIKFFPEYSRLFKDTLKDFKGKDVLVVGHRRPDGDCLGSQIALTRILIDQNINAQILLRQDTPFNLKKFINNTPTVSLENIPHHHRYLTINVDCAEPLVVSEETLKVFPNTYLNIDHHLSNHNYAEVNIVNRNTAATAELLTGMFLDLSFEIDSTTAQALYVGISTDTLQFQTSSTTLDTFILCSELIRLGAQPEQAALILYEQEPIEKMHLLELFLGSLKLELSNRVCIGIVTQEMFKKTHTSAEHTEGFSNYPRSIQGVDIGILIEAIPNGVKASLRSKDKKMRLDLLAAIFNGGGHAAAAGFRVHNTTLEKFYPNFLDTIKNHLNTIQK